jgi:hypothetical protein
MGLDECLKIVKEFAEGPDPIYQGTDYIWYCPYCDYHKNRQIHEESCLWIRAKKEAENIT